MEQTSSATIRHHQMARLWKAWVFALFAVAVIGCLMSAGARAGTLSFTAEPANAVWTEGSFARLSAVVTGPTPHYQWFKEESPVAGGTADTLTFTSISRTNAGHYHVIVSNESGAITS